MDRPSPPCARAWTTSSPSWPPSSTATPPASPTTPPARALRGLARLSSPEAFAAATEALPKAQAKGDLLGVRRLRLLRDFIATQVEESLAAPDAEAVAQLEARARLSVDDQTLSFGEALGQLPHEPNRARRALLESATGGFLWDNRGRYGARREASFRLTERLRAPSYLALREDVSGIELNKLAEAAAETLRLTEDAYRDVLGYVLRRWSPRCGPCPRATRAGTTCRPPPRCRG